VIAMIRRYRDGAIPEPQPVPAEGEDLEAACRQASDRARAALAGFDFRQATAAVWAIADEANRFINRVRPWELARAERDGDTGAGRRLDAVLGALFAACWALGRELEPFLPDAAARITSRCTPRDGRLAQASPAFRRLSVPAHPGPPSAAATVSGLQSGDPEQEQQDQGADDRPDEPGGVEGVDVRRVVFDQVLQEPADE